MYLDSGSVCVLIVSLLDADETVVRWLHLIPQLPHYRATIAEHIVIDIAHPCLDETQHKTQQSAGQAWSLNAVLNCSASLSPKQRSSTMVNLTNPVSLTYRYEPLGHVYFASPSFGRLGQTTARAACPMTFGEHAPPATDAAG